MNVRSLYIHMRGGEGGGRTPKGMYPMNDMMHMSANVYSRIY